jgi:hypothetical protein
MKVIVVSGNPWEQPGLVKQLAMGFTEKSQIVHVHDDMFNVLNTVSRQVSDNELPLKNYELGTSRTVNGNIVSNMEAFFGCAVIGHSLGYNINDFKYVKEETDKQLINSFKSGSNSGMYSAIISGIKDVKYVDCLILYNVLDTSSIEKSITYLKRNYGSELKAYWFNLKTPYEVYKNIAVPNAASESSLYQVYEDTVEILKSKIPEAVSDKPEEAKLAPVEEPVSAEMPGDGYSSFHINEGSPYDRVRAMMNGTVRSAESSIHIETTL